MKIAHLQFTPIQGNINSSIAKVEGLLRHITTGDLDFLHLPELAFAGYTHATLKDIGPYLEPRGSGPSCTWARLAARRLRSFVSVGYAETTSSDPEVLDRELNFNSCIVYGPGGVEIAHYRKCFLYVADEPWCVEGKEGFYAGDFPAPLSMRVAIGICMDINPYRSIAPWGDMEFANHANDSGAGLVLVPMAWNNVALTPEEVLMGPTKTVPDYETVEYWFFRFGPLIAAEKSVILILGNRSGVEEGAIFSGSSLIARVGRGTVEVWDIAGKGGDCLLSIDSETSPKYYWDFTARKLLPSIS